MALSDHAWVQAFLHLAFAPVRVPTMEVLGLHRESERHQLEGVAKSVGGFHVHGVAWPAARRRADAPSSGGQPAARPALA